MYGLAVRESSSEGEHSEERRRALERNCKGNITATISSLLFARDHKTAWQTAL